MLRLGTKVKVNGQDAMVIARTMAGNPRYDVRLSDGRLIKYAVESDLEVVNAAGILAPTLMSPPRGES